MTDEVETLGSLSEEWRTALASWIEGFGESFPVIFYESDGTDSPDEFEPGKHLAVRVDAQTTIAGATETLMWPVDVEGWENIREVEFKGVLPLLKAGKRMKEN